MVFTVGGDDDVLPPVVESDVPAGLEDIVVWIRAQFEIELRRRCPQCYYTTPVDNSTNMTNVTSNETITNATVPVDNSTDNSTVIPVDNSTLPVDNSTVIIIDNSSVPIDDLPLPGGSGAGAPFDNSTDIPSDNSTVIVPPPITINDTQSDNGTDSVNPGNDQNVTLDNGTLPAGYNEGGYNTTDNQTGSSNPALNGGLFNSGNYSLPTNCAFQNADRSSVKCSSGVLRSVAFTFDQINELWEDDLSNVCSDA